jgi:hypothetical protein
VPESASSGRADASFSSHSILPIAEVVLAEKEDEAATAVVTAFPLRNRHRFARMIAAVECVGAVLVVCLAAGLALRKGPPASQTTQDADADTALQAIPVTDALLGELRRTRAARRHQHRDSPSRDPTTPGALVRLTQRFALASLYHATDET